MAKKSNRNNVNTLKSNIDSSWSNHASRAALATQGTFSVSMPKLVQGVAYIQSNGELTIEIRYKKANEYDKIVNILDPVDVKKLTTEYGNNGEVTLIYKKWRKRNSSSKTLIVVFASGYSKSITLKVPGTNSKLANSVDSITSSLTTSPYENMLAADTSQALNNNLLVGVYPKSDPYDVFNYSGVFSYNLPFAYYINSDSLNEIFVNSGISSSNSNVDNGISTRGVGHLFPAEKEQEIHFVNLLYSGSTNIKSRTELTTQLNSTAFTYGFIFGKNLFDIPDDAPIFYVCKNDGDPSFFRTTSKDCDGTTIGTRYLTGDDPAIFLDGQCCSLTCDGFSIVLKNTSVSDANFKENIGKIKVIVTGGQDDWTYKIENTTTGLSTTVASVAESEYEFTGLAFATSSQTPYKVTVTDANGCQAIAYIHLSREINEEVGLTQGCTDSNAITYDSEATFNTGCLYCKSLGPRGEKYGGLSFGDTSAKSKATGEQLIANEHSKITHATAVGSSSGKLYFKGSVHPAALSIINQDTDASYRLALYSLGNDENANALTKTQILALSPNNQDGDLEYEWSSKAPGWYAIAASVLNVPALADCVSIYRFKIGHGGCMDIESSNYDVSASYHTPDACTYNCPEKNVKILTKDTSENCIKTVYLARSKKNEKVTWEIGGEVKTGVGPHLAKAGSNISVYVENSKTKCTNSGEYYIPEEDCYQTPQMARNMSSSMANMLLNSGGCTDPTMFNYDCNAIFDDGSCIPIITGCTDISSSNYNEEANVDDGNCIDAIEGCLFPGATNYNPLATINVPSMCEWGTSGTTGDTTWPLAPKLFLSCPTDINTMDLNTTSNKLFSVLFRVEYGVTIQLGSKLSIYQLPVGEGVTVQGFTMSDITLPMEDSGLNPAAVWKLTGTDANIYTQHTNSSAGLQGYGFSSTDSTNIANPVVTWNSDGTFITTEEVQGNTGYTNLAIISNGVGGSTAEFPADEGSAGPGVHVWELKMIYNGQDHYTRFYSVDPGEGLYGDPCDFLEEYSGSSATNNSDFQPDFTRVAHCTDPTATNFVGSATLSSTLVNDLQTMENYFNVMGIPDLTSSSQNIQENYMNPGIFADASCLYTQRQKYCLPPRIDDQIDYLSKCVMNGSVNWYTNHITGGSDLCEDIALWTVVLIKYLVSRKGLGCVFNCQDMHTPTLEPKTCNEMWLKSGSKVWTYNNDTAYQGNGTYGIGDYVKFNTIIPWMGDGAPNTIWRVAQSCGSDCGNPYGRAFVNGNWEFCEDDISFSQYTVNYLDNFFKFATRYCKSCNPCSFNVGNENSFEVSTDSFLYSTEDDGTLTVGGIPVDYT